MSKILLFIIPLLAISQNPKLNRVTIGEIISIKIPETFTPVPEGEMRNRHVHFRRPLALYTDPNGEIDLSVNQNPTRWRESDIQILKDFQKSNILSLYDDVEFLKEEVKEIRGKKYAIFEFESSVKGDENSFRNNSSLKKYTYIQYTIHERTTLVLNFTSPLRSKPRWSDAAEEIMNSVAFK